MYYVQFKILSYEKYDQKEKVWVKRETPLYIDAIGSDTVYILDSRNNLFNMKCDGYDRLSKMRMIHNDIAGFVIMKSPTKRFSDSKAITGILN